jgi:hypothetical protein
MTLRIRGLRVRALIVASIAAALTPAIASANVIGFGDFSQFTLNQNDSGSPPTISSGTIELTNGGGGEARSLYYNTPQNITSFTASFTYQTPAGGMTVFNFDPSAAFVIQNSPQGVNAVGTGGESFAYSGIPDSAAVSLQLGGGEDEPGSSGTGLFTDGNVTTAASTSPVNLTSGDPINVLLSYSGGRLNETLTDTVTDATFNTTYLTNLQTAIGGPTAYVGFTAATDNSGTQYQYFSNFQFTNNAVPEPSSICLLAIGAIAAGAVCWRRSKRGNPVVQGVSS